MNSEQFHEIVNQHTDAWPDKVEMVGKLWVCDTLPMPMDNVMLMFEASFHRAIRKHTYCMRVEDHKDQIYVIVKHHQFEAPTLIEAYAKALEWLK